MVFEIKSDDMISNSSKKLMIIAGEISGDLIGAALIKEFKKIDKDLEICGIGGDNMKSEGMELIYHINKMAFLGFVEIIKHYPFIKKVKKDLIREVEKRNIKSVVLIDYPGFNLNIAKKFHSMGLRIIYYVSPQLWAWGAGRLNKIKKYVYKMLVVFPFEEKIYGEQNINVEFVGHPLVERINNHNFFSKNKFFAKNNLQDDKEILLLMPGSRKQEVEKIFLPAIGAAKKLAKDYNLQIVVAGSTNLSDELYFNLTGQKDFFIVRGFNYELMKYAKFGIIKSGTSTLEAGYFSLPMVIVYKTSSITYHIGKKLISLKNIGMVNILLNKNVVPELIQSKVNAVDIYKESSSILNSEEKINYIKTELNEVKNLLGETGASIKAAESIYSILNEH